jgi:hypothetical protein
VRQSNRLSAKIINRSTVCAFLPEHLQGICCASVSSHTPGGGKKVYVRLRRCIYILSIANPRYLANRIIPSHLPKQALERW